MLHASVRELIERVPAALEKLGVYPKPIKITGPTTRPVVCVEGRSIVQFGSGNYLGLAQNECAIQEAIDGILEYGLTSSGSRLICGTQDPHIELEKTIAKFQGTDECLVYFLVSAASLSIIPAIMHTPWQKYLGRLGIESSIEEKEIFVDEQCHPTLVDACNLAVGSNRCTRYRHCDMEYLEKMLRRSKAGIRMIATDGVFSADGDTAPLPEIVGLAQRYEAMIFVDDAHGSGVLGRTGQGTWEHYGVSDQIDFKIGSLAKAYAGGLGAFIACGHEMAAYLRFAGGHYTFGGSIPPAIAMAIKANIVTAQHDSWRRDKVLYNAEYVRRRLRNLGYKVIGAGTPIVPIIVGESKVSVEIEHELFKAGYHAPSFRFPAVPQKEARIRATVMATHTEDQLDGFIAAFDNIASGHNATKAMASAQLAA